MIKKLDLYFFNIFTTRMVLTSSVLIAVVWLTKSIQLFQKISEGLPPSILLLLTVYSLPPFLIEVVPLALFIAVITGLSRLILDRELVVMQAAGLSLWRLAYPLIALATLVTFLSLYVHLWLIPKSYESLEELEIASHQYAHVVLSEGQVTALQNNQYIYVQSKDENILHKITLIRHLSNGNQETITAERAIVSPGKDSSVWILLLDGVRNFFDVKKQEFSRLEFSSYNVQYRPKQSSKEKTTRPRELDFSALMQQMKIAKNSVPYKTELHKRLSSPFLAIAYVLIAIAFLKSGNLLRQGHGRNIAHGVLSIILLKAVHFSLFITPMPITLLIFLAYGLVLLSIIVPAHYVYRSKF